MAQFAFVSLAALNPKCECCTVHKPGLYKLALAVHSRLEPAPTQEELERVMKKPVVTVMGGAVCVN